MNAEINEQLERICGLINQGMDDAAVCPYLLSHAIASEPYPINPPPLSAEVYLRAMEQLVTVIRAMVEEWTSPDEVEPLVDIVEQLAELSDCTTPLRLERLIVDAQQVRDNCSAARVGKTEEKKESQIDIPSIMGWRPPKAEIKKDQGVQVLAEEAFLHGVANGTKVLTSPLNREQLQSLVNNDGFIKVCIYVDLNDVVDDNLETDRISLLAVGVDIMKDISYRIVGRHNDRTLIIEVTGNVDDILKDEDWCQCLHGGLLTKGKDDG